MEKRKNSILLIVISVVVIMLLLFWGTLFLLSGMGYVEFKGSSSDKVDEEVIDEDNKEVQEVIKEYKFGDEVVLTELVDWEFYDATVDRSKWKVLAESGDYIKLYSVSEQPWGKIGLLEDMSHSWKKDLEEKDIDFGIMGGVGLLEENDLLLLGCNVETMKCKNTPEWLNNGLTGISFVSDDTGIVNVITIDNDKDNVNGAELISIEDSMALVPVWYTITILKSNLE